MKELYRLLISNDYMSNKEKVAISNKLMNAIVADTLKVTDGLYLKVTDTEDADLMNVELWFKNVDELGNPEHGNTGYNKEQILRVLHEEYLISQESKESDNVKRL